MYFEIEHKLKITHHCIVRYAQRINFLLSEYQIKQNIQRDVDPELYKTLGKHIQVKNGVRYVISGINEIITVTRS